MIAVANRVVDLDGQGDGDLAFLAGCLSQCKDRQHVHAGIVYVDVEAGKIRPGKHGYVKGVAGPAGLGGQAGGLGVLGQVRLIGLEKGGIAGLPGGPDAGEGFRRLMEDRIGRVHVVVDPQAGFRGVGGAKGLQAVDRFRQQPEQGGIEPAPLEGGNIQPGGEGIGAAHVVCEMQIVFPAGPGFQIDGVKGHRCYLEERRCRERGCVRGQRRPW